jgi:hypothetical protein
VADIFSWLPLSDRKGLPTPRVMYADLDWCGGCFIARTAERCIDEDFGIDRREADVIVLSTRHGDVPGSTLAHEHRHFQQHYLQALPRIGVVRPFDDAGGWDAGIRSYYGSQAWEMDALRYSMRAHRDETCEAQWAAVFGKHPAPAAESAQG